MTHKHKYKYHICRQLKQNIWGRDIRIDKHFTPIYKYKKNKYLLNKNKLFFFLKFILNLEKIHINKLIKKLKLLKIKQNKLISINYFYKNNLLEKQTKNTPISFKYELLEKQRLKKYYNLSEKEFSTLYYKLTSYSGNLNKSFLIGFEQRLDSILYRNNFLHTFFFIRQFISHKNILINNKPVSYCNIQLKPGDLIQIKKKAIPFINENILFNIKNNTFIINHPNYFETNYNTMSIIFLYYPTINEIPYHTKTNHEFVKQYYTR